MFFNNYSKPGKGVNKRDPNEPRIRTYFDVLPRKIWLIFKLNLIYLISVMPFFIVTMLITGVVSVPIINRIVPFSTISDAATIDILLRTGVAYLFMEFLGQGPITAGYTYIIREYAEEHHCWLISDFFQRSKMNFKQSFVLWIIDLLLFYIWVVVFNFYSEKELFVMQAIMLCGGIVYVMMHTYVYLMMITYDLPLIHILKNSFLLVIGKAPVNLLIFCVKAIIYVVIPRFILLNAGNSALLLLLMLLVVLLIAPICNFTINFFILPILKKNISADSN